MTQVSSPDTST